MYIELLHCSYKQFIFKLKKKENCSNYLVILCTVKEILLMYLGNLERINTCARSLVYDVVDGGGKGNHERTKYGKKEKNRVIVCTNY